MSVLRESRRKLLSEYYLEWRRLPVFQSVDWSQVALRVKPRTGRDLARSTGEACRRERYVLVRAGTDEADRMATLLHEMAHLVAWGTPDHGSRWRRVLAEACAQATGHYPLVGRRGNVDRAVLTIFKEWG